ncbi:MAG TPA: hypothetical protein PLN61_03660 [bacterium]|nr:hypothetical protein [bacterium]HQI47737.1 hypothetical protein [bacterium]HQJ64098.1 hypothetical protein [bacterium]
MKRFRGLFFLLLLLPGVLRAQGHKYDGPDDPAGDIAAIREGWMNGNRVLLYFKNTTELANWPNFDQSKWPNDYTGTGMHDGIALYIAAKVHIAGDSNPVTDPAEIASRSDLKELFFCQTSYRMGMDYTPDGLIRWGLYPVFGYFNPNSEYPAMSNREDSWPAQGWPSAGETLKWPGEWDGRFGRGIKYADLETYFVANDAQDLEYVQPKAPIKYYPRPGYKIGYKDPGVTIQAGEPWGGLGIRVKQRGYQWNNPQTRDAIFWEYDISNISDYDLANVAFGYLLDAGIGHRGNQGESDDIGFFDKYDDIAYAWDYDGIGIGGVRTGILGMAFLESPGSWNDGLDNDDDGLTDERRDNVATRLIGPTEGITDLAKFLEWYGRAEDQLRNHWDADEDQDWTDGKDANHNGVYDLGEDFGCDVGTDGVAPTDLNYRGPDADGSECNHRPDFVEGLGCEPNFALTDISESDMIGLTGFQMLHHPQENEPPFAAYDKEAYLQIASPRLEEYFGELANLIMTFGAGTFRLPRGLTERISISELHSYEELSGLNSPAHSAPSLFEKKKIVQFIYESDYRFAQPPLMPVLKATPGDGRVILSWDDTSDRFTREPMLNATNDFEGYKLYKATDKYFSDAEKLTDMYGNSVGKLPIFQCDLIDGKKGAADFANINGELYYLGSDAGLQHYYVDTDVQNGRTYYYGLAAYDYGIEGLEVAIMPAENNIVIDLDEDEAIRFTGQNVTIVVPEVQAAGYTAPKIDAAGLKQIEGCGTVSVEILDQSAVLPDHSYRVKFLADTLGYARRNKGMRHPLDAVTINTGLEVWDETLDSLVYRETSASYPGDHFLNGGKSYVNDGQELVQYRYYDTTRELTTDIFHGIRLHFSVPTQLGDLDAARTGWITGQGPLQVQASIYESHGFPYSFDIIFTSDDSATVCKLNQGSYIYDVNGETMKSYLLGQAFNFYVVNRQAVDSTGQYERLDLIVHDVNLNKRFDRFEDIILAGHTIKKKSITGKPLVYWSGTVFSIDFRRYMSEEELPRPNDVYRVSFKRPFSPADTLIFSTKPAVAAGTRSLASALDQILVVPNPYVATNAMETAISNPYLNQRRVLMFTHIPAQCTIRIFTASGIFVDEIVVDNPPERGIVHWDMLTREGLEIAAGVYVYHVRTPSGDERLDKFAVIK